MNFTEIRVKTTTQAVEAVTAIFYEMGISGLLIEDPNDFKLQKKDALSWDYIEEEVFDTGYDGAIVKAYFSEEDSEIPEKIERLRAHVQNLTRFGIDIGEGIVEIGEVHQQDWENAWKKYYKPVKVSEKIVVKPTWEDYPAKLGELIIELDPGMAFGTGTHETTNMCINALEKYVSGETSVLDIGCGSGILSIAAAKLGAAAVIGVDLDPAAVKVSKENIAHNHMAGFVEIRHGDLMEVIEEKADVIVANIIADVIILLSRTIRDYLNPQGIFISSGIILSKKEEVKQALEQGGFELLEENIKGEWCCLVSRMRP